MAVTDAPEGKLNVHLSIDHQAPKAWVTTGSPARCPEPLLRALQGDRVLAEPGPHVVTLTRVPDLQELHRHMITADAPYDISSWHDGSGTHIRAHGRSAAVLGTWLADFLTNASNRRKALHATSSAPPAPEHAAEPAARKRG